MGGTAIMVAKEGGHNSDQNNYHITTFFFQGKVTFMVTFKEKLVFISSLVLKGHMYTVVSLI